MSRFRELMLKFYRTSSSSQKQQPLTEAQNSMFEKRLDQILPLLNHTPDHPPYAWMIQKAIEELAKKRGSSEKLISDHIKKKYKHLPWAHDTLLNHHLKNLCVSGDIVLTKNQKYVFPGLLSSDKKPSKKITKKKHVGKEEDWDWLSEKTKKNKPQKAANDRVIAGKRPSCDPGGQHVLNEVPKGHVVLNEVPEGQDVSNEVRDMEIAEICSSDTQSDVPIPKGQERNAEAHLITKQRLFCDPGQEQSIIAVHEMQDASLIQEGKKLDTDQNLSDKKKTCISLSNPVCSGGTDQVRRTVCKYEFRIPGKIAKENPTKKQTFDNCGPVIEQGQKQLDAQDSEPIDANELQLLPGSEKGLQTEGTTGEMQRKLRSEKLLSGKGTGSGMQGKLLRSCNNKSAIHLKPHVVVGDMHNDDKDSNELSDVLGLEQSCELDDNDDDDATPLESEYRGRGRPRKVQFEEDEEEEEEQQQIVEMESEKPKQNKKRGRGRPPNPKLKKRKFVIRNNDNPEIRRGRGRPRKNIIE